MVDNKTIGVVIVNYHTDNEAIKIAKQYSDFPAIDKIVIVNNDCEELTFTANQLTIIEKTHFLFFKDNLGYSKGNNRGIEYLISQNIDYIIISNSDVVVDNSTIEIVIRKLIECPKYGAMAPRMINFDGNPEVFRYTNLGIKRLFLTIFVRKLDFKQQKKINISDDVVDQMYLPGSLFMTSAENIKRVGMFDEGIFLYREEEILGQRFKQANLKEGILTTCSFVHNHNYRQESIKTKIKKNKLTNKSERHLFKVYYNYNKLQMLLVVFLENIFLLTRIPIWIISNLLYRNDNLANQNRRNDKH